MEKGENDVQKLLHHDITENLKKVVNEGDVNVNINVNMDRINNRKELNVLLKMEKKMKENGEFKREACETAHLIMTVVDE